MKFCYEHRGSISIFLLVIMVPMLLFTFLVLDFAKIDLAKAEARSDTALAASSSLTYYDKALKDAYGLLASSATPEELAKNVTDYYVATMAASGIKVDTSSDIYNLIHDLINGDGIDVTENDNMLNLLPGDDPITIDPIAASAISNPTVMKRQIVEYMKYRAPLTLTTGILEKIGIFKDLGNQADAAKNKIKFEQSLSKVQNKSDDAYTLLQNYTSNIEKVADQGYPQGAIVEDKKEQADMSGGFYGINANNSSLLTEAAGWMRKAVEKTELLFPMRKVIDNKGNLNRKKEIIAKVPDNRVNFRALIDKAKDHSVYGYDQLKNAYDKSSLSNDTYYFYLSEDIAAIYSGTSDPLNNTNSLADFYMSFMKLYYGYKEVNGNKCNDGKSVDDYKNGKPTTDYEKRMEEIYNVLTWAFGTPPVYNASSLKYCTGDNPGELDKLIAEIWSDGANAYDKYTDMMCDYLVTLSYQISICDDMSGDKSPLDDLLEAIKKAKENSEVWNTSINGVQTSTTQAEMRNNFNLEAELVREIDEQAVVNLKNTFGAQGVVYKALYDDLINKHFLSVNNTVVIPENGKYKIKAPKEYSYFLKYWNGIYPVSQIANHQANELIIYHGSMIPPESYNVSSVPVGSNFMNYTKVPEKWIDFSKVVNGVGDSDKAKTNKKVIDVLKKISEKNIIPTKKEKEDMKKSAEDEKKSNIGEAEKKVTDGDPQNEAQKKKLDEFTQDDDAKKKKIKELSEKDNSGEILPTASEDNTFRLYALAYPELIGKEIGLGSDKESSLEITYSSDANEKKDNGMNGIFTMLESLTSMIANLAEAGRDNLYISEYLTNSFSCMTTNISDGKAVTDEKKIEKSLSGLTFSAANNKYYQCELEYIIYGQNSKFANQAAAVGSISAIRFVLNLIYSFTDAEINSFTTATSAALTALVPFLQPVVKTVLHIALSAAETAFDMLELTKGNAVPIYKSASTWVCKCSNIVGQVASEAAKVAINALEDQAAAFLNGKIDDAEATLDKWSEDFLEQQKSSIQATLENCIISPIDSFLTVNIEKAEVLEGAAEEAFRNGYNEMIDHICDSISNISEGGVIKEIADAVCNYVRSDADSIYSELKSIINKTIKDASGSTEGNQIVSNTLKSAREKFNAKATEITKKIKETINKFENKLKDGIKEGAKKAKELGATGIEWAGDKAYNFINQSITDNLSGKRNVEFNMNGLSSDSQNQGSISAKMLSMTYKEYLYLFLYIGLCTGCDKKLERAGHLINCNVRLKNPSFNINMACTMFDVTTKSKIKTGVIGRIADDNKVTLANFNDGYYEISVSSFAGY